MSDLEIIMYIALGFATATLIAMLVSRLLWIYALKLGKRRSQRLAPSNLAELQVERDRLRAEYAMLSRKLELRLQDLRTKLAEQTAEVSRSRNRMERLAEELQARESALAQKEKEFAALREQVAGYEAELATRTESSQGLRDELRAREEAHAALARELEAAARTLAERDREIERLKRERGYTVVEASRFASEPAPAQGGLGERIEHLTALSRQIEAQRLQLMAQQSEYRQLRDSMAELQSPGGQPEQGEPGPGEVSPPAPAIEQENRIEVQTLSLERQLEEAERETAELRKEIERIDARWAAMASDRAEVSAGTGVAPAAAASGSAPTSQNASSQSAGVDSRESEAPTASKKTVPGLANVISLANRIRALQRESRQ